MDEDNAARAGGHTTPMCGKAWTAYIGSMLLALMLFGFAVPLALQWSPLAAGGVVLASVLLVGYRILLIHSVRLYYDDVGVWLYAGILPWNKGVQGVKWRDMDEATFAQSFWSWLFKSYAIRIGHRYTKTSEIRLTHMARGKAVVTALNAHHQELIRSDSLS